MTFDDFMDQTTRALQRVHGFEYKILIGQCLPVIGRLLAPTLNAKIDEDRRFVAGPDYFIIHFYVKDYTEYIVVQFRDYTNGFVLEVNKFGVSQLLITLDTPMETIIQFCEENIT